MERVFPVCGDLTAGKRNSLSKKLEIHAFLKVNKKQFMQNLVLSVLGVVSCSDCDRECYVMLLVVLLVECYVVLPVVLLVEYNILLFLNTKCIAISVNCNWNYN